MYTYRQISTARRHIERGSELATMKDTIRLADGYNGHTMLFYREPLVREGNFVKLRCAEPGKEYLIRWAHVAYLK